MRIRERKVEQRLNLKVKNIGGWSIKLLPSVAGLPDRLVILPGGRVFFVELKAPTGTVQIHQTVVHHRLKELGATVVVLSTLPEVDEWISTHSST